MDLSQDGSPLAIAGAAIFVALALAEVLQAQPPEGRPTRGRWLGNLSLYLVTAGLMALPGLGGLAVAWSGAGDGIGLLPRLGPPDPLRLVLGVLALDAVGWGIHVLMHKAAPLWRLHLVHHTDAEIDVTTHLRHHPGEALVGVAMNATAVLVLGLGVAEVAAYGVLVALVQTLAHANLALPPRLSRALGTVFVTPEFHRLHHSRWQPETDSNYGQAFVFWDRLFGTARRRAAEAGPIAYGLDGFDGDAEQAPHRLLLQPFRGRG